MPIVPTWARAGGLLVAGIVFGAPEAAADDSPYAQALDARIRSHEPFLACLKMAYQRKLLVGSIKTAFDVAEDGTVSNFEFVELLPEDPLLFLCFQQVISGMVMPIPEQPGRQRYGFAWDHSGEKVARLELTVSGPPGGTLLDFERVKSGVQQKAEPLVLCLAKNEVPPGNGATIRVKVKADGSVTRPEVEESSGRAAADACLLETLPTAWVDHLDRTVKADLRIVWDED